MTSNWSGVRGERLQVHAQADLAAHQEPASDKARQAVGRTQAHGSQSRPTPPVGARDLQDRIDPKRQDLDVKNAERDAGDAEENALDALGFARWAVKQAEVAVLDAVDTRAWADERAAASQKN